MLSTLPDVDGNPTLPEKSALRCPPQTIDEDEMSPFRTRDKVRRTFKGTAIKALVEGRLPPPADPFEQAHPFAMIKASLRPSSQRLSQTSDLSENISLITLRRGKSLKSRRIQIAPTNQRRVISTIPRRIDAVPSGGAARLKNAIVSSKPMRAAQPTPPSPDSNSGGPLEELADRSNPHTSSTSSLIEFATKATHQTYPPIPITPPPATYHPNQSTITLNSKTFDLEKTVYPQPPPENFTYTPPLKGDGPNFNPCACLIL
ncbi:hypothetical protein L0F63_003891, partial [Massospora cicadina]